MSGEGLTSGVTNKGQEESVGKYWLHKKRFLTSKKRELQLEARRILPGEVEKSGR